MGIKGRSGVDTRSAEVRVGVAVEADCPRVGFDSLLVLAAAVDRLGFSHFSLAAPRSECSGQAKVSSWDPIMMVANLVGRHPRLTLGIIDFPLARRQTALVARQIADLAIFADGQLRFGVSSGGEDPETGGTGARPREQIGLLRQLWCEQVVSTRGTLEHFDRVALVPRPSHPVPIWVDEVGALSAMARDAAGVFVGGPLARGTATFRQIRDAVEGRRDAALAADLVLRDGAPGNLPEVISDWSKAGGTHVTVMLTLPSTDHREDVVSMLDSVSHEIGLSPWSNRCGARRLA